MFCKFALFLAVALCATQGFHARGVDPNIYGVDDIISSINDVIVKIHTALADMVMTIPKLLGDLEKEIKKLIGSIENQVSNVVDLIEDAIQDILAQAGIDVSGARLCIDAERAAVEQMVRDANNAIERCENDALDSAKEIHDEMNRLKRKALDLVVSINTGTAKCLVNPFKILKCLKNHLADVTEDAEDLIEQMADTVVTATRNVAEITVTLTTCTASITTDLLTTKARIISDFARCVADL